MATQGTPQVPHLGADVAADVAMQRPWRMRGLLSSFGDAIERFLSGSGFDRGPWLVVAFATGIAMWFGAGSIGQWSAAIGCSLLVSLAGAIMWRGRDDRAHSLVALVAVCLALAAGIAVIWSRSELIGQIPIESPSIREIDARILDRKDQPADGRVRLILAARDQHSGRAVTYRVNLPEAEDDRAAIVEGARVRLKARLMPPSPPILPGAYDFSRRAWFEGYAATGSVMGEIEIIEPGNGAANRTARIQRKLSGHVRERLTGAAGTIAAAFASGDRGAISRPDEDAMRDAGLTHLLSISGLHVSAVIAAVYFITLRILALWPWLALRVRLPLLAAATAATAGIGYTLLTGAQVPTVRSCMGAVLVLIALALGREPLSMRMVAVAAAVVLLLWPESLVGPSFQMSFAAVIVIVALRNAEPVRNFLAPREESWFGRISRRAVMLFVTGLAIEIALMPIVLFHFHRSGLYGAAANIVAIPLVTFISMPLIALALLLDVIGLGAPAWWLAGQSLEGLLALARFTAEQPGAVKLAPRFDIAILLLFVAGGLWIALWHGRARMIGLIPVMIGIVAMALTPIPDVLIARNGQEVGIAGDQGQLLVLHDSSASYAQENLQEISSLAGEPVPLAQSGRARCSREFCTVPIHRNGNDWIVLVARTRDLVEERALAAACERADIVIADRYLPRSCRPRWLKADRRFFDREGGAVIYLEERRIETVAASQGDHGWWRAGQRR